MSDRRSHPFPWFAAVFMVFLVLVVGGVVAIAYSPLIANLFRDDPPVQASSPVHEDSVPGAPAPDNTITAAPPPSTPGPDNTIIDAPASADPDAAPPPPPPSPPPPPPP